MAFVLAFGCIQSGASGHSLVLHESACRSQHESDPGGIDLHLYLNGISVAESWIKTEKVNWIVALVGLNGSVALVTALLFVRRVWMQRWVPLAISELPYKLFGRDKS